MQIDLDCMSHSAGSPTQADSPDDSPKCYAKGTKLSTSPNPKPFWRATRYHRHRPSHSLRVRPPPLKGETGSPHHKPAKMRLVFCWKSNNRWPRFATLIDSGCHIGEADEIEHSLK